MLAVILPANIVFVQSIVDQVVNFSVFDKAILQEKLIDPILEKSEDQTDEDFDADIDEVNPKEFKSI